MLARHLDPVQKNWTWTYYLTLETRNKSAEFYQDLSWLPALEVLKLAKLNPKNKISAQHLDSVILIWKKCGMRGGRPSRDAGFGPIFSRETGF